MSKNILFISETSLKETSFLSENVDPKQLLPTVKTAQDKHLLPLLGSALYNKLQADINNNSITGDYKVLMDEYITDVIVWYTLSEIPMPLQYKMLNKGIVTRTGETISGASFTEVQSMMGYCKDNAMFYAQRCREYLCANQDKFTEYKSVVVAADSIRPDKTQYQTSIYLGPSPWVNRGRMEDKYR